MIAWEYIMNTSIPISMLLVLLNPVVVLGTLRPGAKDLNLNEFDVSIPYFAFLFFCKALSQLLKHGAMAFLAST